MGKVGKALELASGAIGIANDLGIPTDALLGGFFADATADALAEISAEIRALQQSVDEGFATTNANNFLRQISEAAAPSSEASTQLRNPLASQFQKALALEKATTGLSNMSGTVTSLLDAQSGAYTPQVITKLYEAMAFSLSVQINTAAAWSSGEKIAGEYIHGGTMAFQSQIQEGLAALGSIEAKIAESFATVSPVNFAPLGVVDIFNPLEFKGRFTFEIGHKFETVQIARTFYQDLLDEVLLSSDKDFGDDFLRVTDTTVTYFFPQVETLPINPTSADIFNASARQRGFVEQMKLVINDKLLNFFTGELSPLAPGSFKLYSWNDPDAVGFDDLISEAQATINGFVRTVSEASGGTLDGAAGGDFLAGRSGNDTINGLKGDDYLLGNGGNDFLFGGDGNDRYFGGAGSDGLFDTGASTDVDVAVFEGNFSEYTFFREVGENVRILAVRELGFVEEEINGVLTKFPVIDTDVMRGIELLKFDDEMVRTTELTLQEVDKTPPAAPVILGYSTDNGVSDTDNITSDGTLVFNGTAEANSTVVLEMDQFAVGSTEADETGAWVFDFSETDLDDALYEFTAFAIDDAGNGSDDSRVQFIRVDKTAPVLEAASMTSSSGTTAARVGDTLTLLFTPDEFLSAVPEVTLAGLTAVVTDLGLSSARISRDFSATVTLDETAVSGSAEFLVSMTDFPSNVGTGSALTSGAAVTIDVPVVEIRRNQIDGDDADNTLTGTAAADLIRAGGGNDEIRGLGGTDLLQGAAGDDHIYGDSFELRYGLTQANQVFRLYQAAFDRAPDQPGQKAWTAELFSGSLTLAEVTAGFVGSREFAIRYAGFEQSAFVEELYRNVLNRDVDKGEVSAAEIAIWTTPLARGDLDRAGVVNGFSESREFGSATLAAANALAVNGNPAEWSDDVYRLYRATLDRDPDTEGFAFWPGQLAGGRAYTEVVGGFTNSTEFKNTYGDLSDPTEFVTLLYDNVLDRLPDVVGLAGWVGLMNGGTTRETVVEGFAQSGEFRRKTAPDLKEWMRSEGLDDEIDGGSGTNVLAGGSMADKFIFNQGDAGTHTVLDLEAWDFVSFEGFGYATAADARAQMRQSGGEVVFSDQGSDVTFQRFQLETLTDDMIMV